ncbi:MAG: exodeoxyribonuclease VII large subunit [Firmicutes bacterium]|nr:exodeoxyribonuclease VII large subunit [Bacillota bacterium]
MEKGYFTVSELTSLIKGLLEAVPVLQGIWVRGEISNFSQPTSGHMYFYLKDAGARLRCVMFRGTNFRLRFRPADGLEVFAFGSVGVYERNGEYQFYVEALEPAGLGSLYLSFLQLKERLEKEGLFDPARKRPLPRFPRRVALVTSPTGAAVRDMIKILRQRHPGVDILVIPCLVQGPEAAPSIAAALEKASRLAEIDLVIVGRGGGSPEELWPFNEEIVARAIVACRHPVIAAVGHEIDITIADFVADHRAPTPTAAAEMAVPDMRLLRAALADLNRRLIVAARRRLAAERVFLERLLTRSVFIRPTRILAGPRQRLDEARYKMEASLRRRLGDFRTRLGGLAGKLEAVSPLATLARGYAVCLSAAGRIVRASGEVDLGEEVRVLLARGRLRCLVREKEES